VLLQSCKPGLKYPYAIRDFREALQPALGEIVGKGIVGYDSAYSFLKAHATDGELQKLSYSEHPVLRATALGMLQYRKGIDNFELLMQHLDDTAFIAFYHVDWEITTVEFSRIADKLVLNSSWKNMAEKNKTIDKVITEHNDFKCAYYILRRIGTQQKYYPFIKKMVENDEPFQEREEALFALAKYKNKGDVPLIKKVLLNNSSRLSVESFELMQEYPDTAYLDVLEDYSKWGLFHNIKERRRWDEGQIFFDALAIYKNERSAVILGNLLNGRPFLPCNPEYNAEIKLQLMYAIKNNNCKAYAKLEAQIHPLLPKHEEIAGPSYPNTPNTIAVNIPEYSRW